MESSKKEYERLTDIFNKITNVINGYSKDTIDNYFDKSKSFIEEEIYKFQHLTELRKKKFLLRSYLTKIENSLTEENSKSDSDSDSNSDFDFIDENDISYKSILNSYNKVNEKINTFENELNNSNKERENLIDFSIFNDLSTQVLRVNYKKYECEFNFSSFNCEKKDNWKKKYFG